MPIERDRYPELRVPVLFSRIFMEYIPANRE
ncbi:hypothetical protein SAAL107622_03635 [Lacicoccus alkaliphilus]